MIHPLIQNRLPEIRELCGAYGVARLDLFGSAVGERFDTERSDFDFLVTFRPMSPKEHADSFFGLADSLERLFGRRVDLLERAPIENPYLLRSIDETRVALYAA